MVSDCAPSRSKIQKQNATAQQCDVCCNTTVELSKEMGSWRRLQQQHEHIEESLSRQADVKLNDYSDDNLVDVVIEKDCANIKEASTNAFNDYCTAINECIAKYDMLVREKLYPHKSDINVQFVGPKKLYCLVCNCEIPYSTDNCYVKHISHHRHKRRIKYLLVSLTNLPGQSVLSMPKQRLPALINGFPGQYLDG